MVNRSSDTDDGACNTTSCTLREAINAANAASGLDNIHFDIDSRLGTVIPTITPDSPLPTITSPVIIDGTTQPAGLVQLSGVDAGLQAHGLRITAGNSTVRGMVINRFDGNGILLSTNGGNFVQGCFIGTNASGTASLPNGEGVPGGAGVKISNSPDNVIGGTQAAHRNILSGNHFAYGVSIFGTTATGNFIRGNYIGTDATGTIPLRNQIGVDIWSPENTVGGSTIGARNIISGNYSSNVHIFDGGSGASGNRIQGNYIGTDVTGTLVVDPGPQNPIGISISGDETFIGGIGGGHAGQPGNVISGNQTGVRIFSGIGTRIQGNLIGTNTTGTGDLGNNFAGVEDGGTDTEVGGSALGAGNVISANNHGISVFTATGTVIKGNVIGSNAAGTALLGNTIAGIYSSFGTNITIGGSEPGEGNFIVGSQYGIQMNSGPAIIQGNTIGQVGMGNLAGILLLSESATEITIGGIGAGNIVTGNSETGIWVLCFPTCPFRNPITRNSIFDNGLLGIDLDVVAVPPDGVTANDTFDSDDGPNESQNYPTISSALEYAGDLRVRGRLTSASFSSFTIELFNNSSCDPSGHGEGKTWVGAFDVTTGFSGVAEFDIVPRTRFLRGFLTATATDSLGNTSEFSHCAEILNDEDGDEIADINDNCPAQINPGQEDADGDDVGDLCDGCQNTVPGAAVDSAGCPPVLAGDFNRDGDIDGGDFARFAECLLGPDTPSLSADCLRAHFDEDDDIDHYDVALFQSCFSGDGTFANPACAK